MMRLARFASFVLVCLLATTHSRGESTTYPQRPIKIIAPYTPGGPSDTLARVVAEKLSARFGTAVVVENRSGGGGSVGAATAAKAPADGYTLLMLAFAHCVQESLMPDLPYRVVRDFAPITRVASLPLVLAGRADLPPRSTAELVEYARTRPRQLTYASAGNGTSQHLAMEQFRQLTGIELIHVPYPGLPQGISEMLAGRIHLAFTPMSSLLPYINAGALRGYAVTTTQRVELLPGLPTFAELGYEQMALDTWHGLVAPAGTPQKILDKLGNEVTAILATPEIRAKLTRFGALPAPLRGAEFGSFIRQEVARYAHIVRAGNIKAD
jgi:tripartite-type tricarboxylate transporter receptor subunit TctC